MRRPGFIPSPLAFLSAALAFGLLIGTAMLAQATLPTLLEMLESQPRLAVVGFSGVVLAPAIVAMLVHHFGHRALDTFDAQAKRRILPSVHSWWAGASAWLIICGASLLARLAMFVVMPPKLDPDSFAVTAMSEASAIAHSANLATLYPVFWVLIAAQLFEMERRTRRGGKRKPAPPAP